MMEPSDMPMPAFNERNIQISDELYFESNGGKGFDDFIELLINSESYLNDAPLGRNEVQVRSKLDKLSKLMDSAYSSSMLDYFKNEMNKRLFMCLPGQYQHVPMHVDVHYRQVKVVTQQNVSQIILVGHMIISQVKPNSELQDLGKKLEVQLSYNLSGKKCVLENISLTGKQKTIEFVERIYLKKFNWFEQKSLEYLGSFAHELMQDLTRAISLEDKMHEKRVTLNGLLSIYPNIISEEYLSDVSKFFENLEEDWLSKDFLSKLHINLKASILYSGIGDALARHKEEWTPAYQSMLRDFMNKVEAHPEYIEDMDARMIGGLYSASFKVFSDAEHWHEHYEFDHCRDLISSYLNEVKNKVRQGTPRSYVDMCVGFFQGTNNLGYVFELLEHLSSLANKPSTEIEKKVFSDISRLLMKIDKGEYLSLQKIPLDDIRKMSPDVLQSIFLIRCKELKEALDSETKDDVKDKKIACVTELMSYIEESNSLPASSCISELENKYGESVTAPGYVSSRISDLLKDLRSLSVPNSRELYQASRSNTM